MNDWRKWMLVVTALGISCYTLWTLLLAGLALMADSSKESRPFLAASLLWPLCELVWTWMRAARVARQSARSKRQSFGYVLFIAALVLPPLLWFGTSYMNAFAWELTIIVPMAVTIAACWAARLMWSIGREAKTAVQR
jgi:hypothetical protein